MKYIEDHVNCSFDSLTYKENPKSSEINFQLTVKKKTVYLKSTGEKYIPPKIGVIRAQFSQSVYIPTLSNAIDEQAFGTFQIIVENGRTEADRKQWLQLLSQDINLTTSQAQRMIDRFIKNKTIGPGGITTLDVFKSIWTYIVDTENMFDFLCRNVPESKRKDLIYGLTIKTYKFNWSNPTANWYI